MKKTPLDSLFTPRSVAIIGASTHPNKVGAQVLTNVRASFAGKIYPVHPTAKSIHGVRAYSSLTKVPRAVDLVIIATPAATVPALLEECARHGSRNVVVLSAGFQERGTEGKQLEHDVRSIVIKKKLNLLGPNCLGFVIGGGVNASFAHALPKKGNVAILSQSGAMAVAIADWAQSESVAIRALVSMGNKAGLDERALLHHFAHDAATDAIVLYLESIEHGQEFAALCKSVTRKKPVIVLKAGHSVLAQRAVSFHTGAIAGSNAILNAALRHAGVILVNSIEQLFSDARLFAVPKKLTSNTLVIVTNAGGPGIMATDAAASSNLQLAPLSAATIAKLRTFLPDAASTANPVDIIGDADTERFRKTLNVCANEPGLGALLVLLTPQAMTKPMEVAQAIISVARRHPHLRVVTSFLGASTVQKARNLLLASGVPQYNYPERAIAAVSDQWAQQTLQVHDTPSVSGNYSSATYTTIRRVLAKHTILIPPHSTTVIQKAGFANIPERWTDSLAHVPALARTLDFPVVLKRISPRLVHKTDGGGIWINIANTQQLSKVLREARRRFPHQEADEGWLVQQQRPGSLELFLGAQRDPSFGPAVTVGLGGTDVELLRTATTLVAPLSRKTIIALLHASALAPWLLTRRGHAPIPVGLVADVIVALLQLLQQFPDIEEVDINPLLVTHKRTLVALDSRIRVNHFA